MLSCRLTFTRMACCVTARVNNVKPAKYTIKILLSTDHQTFQAFFIRSGSCIHLLFNNPFINKTTRRCVIINTERGMPFLCVSSREANQTLPMSLFCIIPSLPCGQTGCNLFKWMWTLLPEPIDFVRHDLLAIYTIWRTHTKIHVIWANWHTNLIWGHTLTW